MVIVVLCGTHRTGLVRQCSTVVQLLVLAVCLVSSVQRRTVSALSGTYAGAGVVGAEGYRHALGRGQDVVHHYGARSKPTSKTGKIHYTTSGVQQVSENLGVIPFAVRQEISELTTHVAYELDDRECVLGRAHHYLASWLNLNATINCANQDVKDVSLDLSYKTGVDVTAAFVDFLNGSDSPELQFLSLAYRNMYFIPYDDLQMINETLQYMSVTGNYFQGLDLPILLRLTVLDIRNCGLMVLPYNVFTNVPNLRQLFLSQNYLMRLSAAHFRPIAGLQHLDMAYNGQYPLTSLLSIEKNPDPYNSLTEGLELSEDVFLPLVNLTFLDVSHSKILPTSARAFRNVMVEQLSLCYTGISIILGSMMYGSLSVLDISGNPGITTAIHKDTYDTRALNVNIEILACENASVKNMDWIYGMMNLKVLLLSHNNINQLTNETFATLEQLEILDLSHNHISNWHQRVFDSNSMLSVLDLSDNNLNVLTSEMLYDFAGVQFLAIGRNSFVCHCLLREFIEMAVKNSENIGCIIQNIGYHLNSNNNATPDAPESDDVGIGVIPTVDMADPAKVAALEVLNSTLYEIYFRVMARFVSELAQSTAKIKSSFEKYIVHPEPVAARSLVHTRLYSRRFITSCNITDDSKIDGSKETQVRNESDLLPDHPLYGIEIQLIDFDENDYKCMDLENSEYNFFEQERCNFDRTMLQNLFPEYNTTAYVVKFLLIFFGFALVAFIIYISKWEFVKYFCIIVRNATILSLMKSKNEALLKRRSMSSTGVAYMYDVFVSYSEQDRQWVLDELLPNLEKSEDITVCLHERDFKVGVSILENIIHCMDQSRSLLLVMSGSFLMSHWCQFEMHLAQHRLMETRREQLILIFLEDIPKAKRPKTLQYLMKTKTYINWPQNPGTTGEEESLADDANGKRKSKSRSARKQQQRTEQTVAVERKMFWGRLRRAINDSIVWEQEVVTAASYA